MGTHVRACLAVVAFALLEVSSCYTLSTAPRCPAARRPRHAAVRLDGEAEGGVKIAIKPKSTAAGAAVSEGSSDTKVSIKVRPKGDLQSAVEAPPAVEDMKTTIKVSKPKAAPAPPPAPVAAPRPFEEELLLNATQSANCTQILEALQMGANPNVRDPKGRTPLHFMAGVGLAPACVLLIHFGAQIDLEDYDGLTPMHMAAGYANARSLKVLVAAGADVNKEAPGQGTPLNVVKAMGEFQWNQVFGPDAKKQRFKKKDEKLEKLKNCMDALLEPEKTIEENKWEDMLTDTMKLINVPRAESAPAEPTRTMGSD